jgi:hypothetical protein
MVTGFIKRLKKSAEIVVASGEWRNTGGNGLTTNDANHTNGERYAVLGPYSFSFS